MWWDDQFFSSPHCAFITITPVVGDVGVGVGVCRQMSVLSDVVVVAQPMIVDNGLLLSAVTVVWVRG
jgi:hypothetical protein